MPEFFLTPADKKTSINSHLIKYLCQLHQIFNFYYMSQAFAIHPVLQALNCHLFSFNWELSEKCAKQVISTEDMKIHSPAVAIAN